MLARPSNTASSPALAADRRVTLLDGGPIAAAWRAGPERYDIIDVSADFVDAAPANVTGVTEDGGFSTTATIKTGNYNKAVKITDITNRLSSDSVFSRI